MSHELPLDIPQPSREPAALADKRLSSAQVKRLRAFARARRRLSRVVLVAPLALIFVVDLAIRGGRLAALGPKHLASYGIAMFESAVLWGLLLFVASSRKGAFRWVAAALFVVLATVSMGTQLYFYRQYSTYLNLDATLFGTSLSASLFGQLKADGKNFITSVLPPFAFAVGLVIIARFLVRPARTRVSLAARLAVPFVVVAPLLIPCSYRTVQASTPDVVYFHALGGLIKHLLSVQTPAQIRPGLRTPPALPPLRAAPLSSVPGARAPHRNVLFILTESVRADVVCSDYRDECPGSPAVNAAAPGRIPLLQMRSNASTTAIQLAVLWSGLEPTRSREELHQAPLLFDYARAAGFDNAYWTSHHMMFANSRLFVQDLPTSHQCGATDLDPHADIDLGGGDELLTERVKREIGSLKEPFFAVVHYGNTHVPYRVDPAVSPFQPSVESKAPSENEAYRNYYKNAVYLQDKTIGDFIRFVRSSPLSDRTVIVFTSDHGEAFREHGQVGHTGAILDEEIHVPGWIDAPPGALGPGEEAALRSMRQRPVFHTDVTPTILDLMGLLGEPSIEPYKAKMVGSSLLRPDYRTTPLYLTNCTGIWGCVFKNWGVMRGQLKLEAREWDRNWHCYDVLSDPKEERDLGLPACGDLVDLAVKAYGGLPSEQ